jgi:hypothetical protein
VRCVDPESGARDRTNDRRVAAGEILEGDAPVFLARGPTAVPPEDGCEPAHAAESSIPPITRAAASKLWENTVKYEMPQRSRYDAMSSRIDCSVPTHT